MRRLLAALAALVGIVLTVVVLAGTGFLAWMHAEVPEDSGSLPLAGLSKPAEVRLDVHGIPHIFAATEADGYRALGYMHARDRLFQMELTRRIGAGRLSELTGTMLGDWALRFDKLMRTLGLYRTAEASLAKLPADVRAALDAYAAGVNSYLRNRTSALPLEFQLLMHEPEPWRPADSLVWGKLMALQLSGNFRQEMANARLQKALSPEQLRDLFPERQNPSRPTLAAALDGMDFADALARVMALPTLGPDTASNEWVLGPSRTTTGAPILANDPHLGLEAPVLWYLARIVTPERALVGATAPGVPFHILGHNGRVAWGFTTTHSDTQDLFVEKLVPGDPGRYLTPEGPRLFDSRDEIIKVRGGSPVALTVRQTRHGPVMAELEPDALPAGHVLALAFPALSEDDTGAEALYRLNGARNATEVRAALRLHRSPQQNVVYADGTGTIGFASPGVVPVRRKGDGTVPVPGWTDEYAWTGVLPFDVLPQSENPPAGKFVNANNAVVGPTYPYLLTAEWPDGARAERIDQVLGDRRLSVADNLALQMDVVSLPARAVLPLLLQVRVSDGRVAEAIGQLRDWDGTMRRDRPEPLIYSWWMRELTRALFADELGSLFELYWDLRPQAVRRALTTAPHWCDDVTTSDTKETCADVLERSLTTALAAMEARHGPQLVTWQWGAEHRATLNHRLLGAVPLVRDLFDVSLPTDGDFHTVNRGAGSVADPVAPFAHRHGAGFRAVYDLSNLADSRFVIATGQSGNPLSRHWGDFAQRWRDGATVTLSGGPDELTRAGASRLLFTTIGARP